MPRDQKIRRVIDALAGQHRVIIWLECGHNVFISDVDWFAQDHFTLPTIGEVVVCSHCPDPLPPTAEEIRRGKTATALWKEAGEP